MTGSLESNSIYYLDDSVLGSPEHPWGSNNYFKLDYAKGGFTAGLQAEYYPQALAGYPAELKGAGLTGLYAAWTGTNLEVTAGSFFEQLGSGLLLRTWEDRELGLNNTLTGGRLAFHTANRGLSVKVLGGLPKYGLWPSASTAVAGADLSLDLLPLFGRESEHSFVVEGSVLNKFTRKVEDNIAFLASAGGFEGPGRRSHGPAACSIPLAVFPSRANMWARGPIFIRSISGTPGRPTGLREGTRSSWN